MTITANDSTQDGLDGRPGPDGDRPDSTRLSSDRADSNGLVSGPGPDVAEPQSFDTLLKTAAEVPGDIPAILTAQVVTSDEDDVVLLGPATSATSATNPDRVGSVDVLINTGVLIRRDRYATATLVTDPDRRERVLRLSLSRLAARYRETLDTLETQRREATGNAAVLSEIREYVIGWHRDDEEISREDLDDFLDRFGLSPYRPRVQVEYTITGRYIVSDSDTDVAQADAENYLRPDLSQIDRVEEDSDTYTVSVDDVLDDGYS